jgi:hypothetical protein
MTAFAEPIIWWSRRKFSPERLVIKSRALFGLSESRKNVGGAKSSGAAAGQNA